MKPQVFDSNIIRERMIGLNSNILHQDVLNQLAHLKMGFDLNVNQGLGGVRKSRAKGTSVEFSDFREYQLGDDIRRIDWNAYGRTDKLYIKQYMEEKEGVFQIFLDTSASMNYGSVAKSQMALQVAAALAYVILRNLDRVYINEVKENSLQKGKGCAGMAAFPQLLNELGRISFDGKTRLSQTILSRPVSAGGMSIIISDFLDKDGIEQAVRYLAYRKQRIVLVQILANEKVEIAYEGTVQLKDMETNEQLKITMSNAAVLEYQNALKEMQTNLQKLAVKYGGKYVKLRSDDNLTEVMLQACSGVFGSR